MECIPSILYCGARSLYSCTANFEPRAQGGFTPQAPLCKKKPKGGAGRDNQENKKFMCTAQAFLVPLIFGIGLGVGLHSSRGKQFELKNKM